MIDKPPVAWDQKCAHCKRLVKASGRPWFHLQWVYKGPDGWKMDPFTFCSADCLGAWLDEGSK